MLNSFLGELVMADEMFFPPSYKTFAFAEGDFVASQNEDGTWELRRILKIDKVTVEEGASINIMGQEFTAPFDDYLLIISIAFIGKEGEMIGKGEVQIQMADSYESLDEVKESIANHSWITSIGHMPVRTESFADDSIVVGHEDITEEDLAGYAEWKEAFINGEAGIF